MRTEIREVRVRQFVPLDEGLTKPCTIPVFSEDTEITYGDVVTYSVQLMGIVEECNKRLAAIRVLEDGIVE